MSAVDNDSTVVVWREPVSIAVRRLVRRSVIPALAFAGWALELAPWAVLLMSIAALPSALLLVFGVMNLAVNRRVTLVHTGGALVWPRSVQEMLLNREPDHVTGPRIEVLMDMPSLTSSRRDPHVTLSDDDRTILRFALNGTDVDDFIAHVNDLVRERGVTLIRVEPDLPPDPEPEPDSDVSEFDWPDDAEPPKTQER